jgi:hypothetical protein
MSFPRRASGLWILTIVVTVGMGIPIYYRWKVGDLGREREKVLADAPHEPRTRLEWWFEFMEPQILTVLHSTRFSAAQPWLVSHVVRPRSADQPPEIWGVPDDEIDIGTVVLDGMTVRVILPAPRIVGRDVLVGDNSLGVQVYPPDHPPADPGALLRDRIEAVLSKMTVALERDLPGARLVVEVGGMASMAVPGAAEDD